MKKKKKNALKKLCITCILSLFSYFEHVFINFAVKSYKLISIVVNFYLLLNNRL